jgi:multiple sugar transport system ATP-binding protein
MPRGGELNKPLVVKAPGNLRATPGQRVALALPADALHLFDGEGKALTRKVTTSDLQLPRAA